MSEYLLPCSCGRNQVVSARHAGHSLRCECGNELVVPTLRGLQDLQPAGGSAPARRREWGTRQRVAFVLAATALGAAAIAGYVWSQRPEVPEPPAPLEITQDTPLAPLFDEYLSFVNFGVAGPPENVTLDVLELKRRYDMTMWGVRIAAAAAGCALVASIIVALSGGTPKR